MEEISELKVQLNDLRRQLSRAKQPLEDLKPIQKKLEKLEESLQQPIEKKAKTEGMRPLEIGDRVRIISLKMDGLVSHIDDEEVEIQVGSLRLRANPSDLQLVDDKMTKTEPASTRVIPAKGKRGGVLSFPRHGSGYPRAACG